jgi:hypothetical protein
MTTIHLSVPGRIWWKQRPLVAWEYEDPGIGVSPSTAVPAATPVRYTRFVLKPAAMSNQAAKRADGPANASASPLDGSARRPHPQASPEGTVLLLLAHLTFAAPTVTVADDGAVTGVVDLAIPPAELRARLADPTWLPTISKDGTRVTVAGRDGDCLLVDSVSPSAIMTVSYRVRTCPTPTGYASTLVESQQFSSYATSWQFKPSAAGTQATYHIRVATSTWIPDAVVRRGVRSGIEQMLTNLETWAATRRSP